MRARGPVRWWLSVCPGIMAKVESIKALAARFACSEEEAAAALVESNNHAGKAARVLRETHDEVRPGDGAATSKAEERKKSERVSDGQLKEACVARTHRFGLPHPHLLKLSALLQVAEAVPRRHERGRDPRPDRVADPWAAWRCGCWRAPAGRVPGRQPRP